jgi:hypothetical protein
MLAIMRLLIARSGTNDESKYTLAIGSSCGIYTHYCSHPISVVATGTLPGRMEVVVKDCLEEVDLLWPVQSPKKNKLQSTYRRTTKSTPREHRALHQRAIHHVKDVSQRKTSTLAPWKASPGHFVQMLHPQE